MHKATGDLDYPTRVTTIQCW